MKMRMQRADAAQIKFVMATGGQPSWQQGDQMKKATLKRLEDEKKNSLDYLAAEDNYYHMTVEEQNQQKKKSKRSKPVHKKWDE